MKKTSVRSASRFAFLVAVLAFPISGVFDTSTIFLHRVNWYLGAVALILIIVIGVVFDMIGIAAAAARETPFHAMASKRIFGARRAIRIVRNAEKVSSVCSDVVGDIAGVLSGASALAVGGQVALAFHASTWTAEFLVILITALTTAVTIGAKAVGKTVAIQSPTPIILFAARTVDALLFVRHPHRKRSK